MPLTRLQSRRFGFHSTAEEVLSGHNLSGRVALVTGGNSGIGQETARVLALHGCQVIITSRQADAADKAIEKMKSENSASTNSSLPAAGDVSYVTMDLADLDTVKAGVERILQQTTVIDYLILNAGVMACPYQKTKNNLEMQIGTNHFGHFAMTQQLLQGFSKPPSRVAVLSSVLHRAGKVNLEDLHYTKGRKYDKWEAYGQSKTANLLFAAELTKRAEGAYIAVGVHPGVIRTNLVRHLSGARTIFSFISYFPWLYKVMVGENEKNIPQGAATTLWAILSEDLKGGEYCVDCGVSSPLHDQVMDSDIQKQFWELTEKQLASIAANNGTLQE